MLQPHGWLFSDLNVINLLVDLKLFCSCFDFHLIVLQKQAVDSTKEKCRKFLANLLELSSREPKQVEKNVRTLIQELIDTKVRKLQTFNLKKKNRARNLCYKQYYNI